MSAAMELHVALSLRLDATEAYRLAHAYRDEVRREDADRLLAERRHHDGSIFCDGLKHAADLLTEWADNGTAPAPDDSETAALHRVLRKVEVAARRGDLATIRHTLANHHDQNGGGRRD